MAAPHLTLITDTKRFSGDAGIAALTAALIGGVDAVLIREKTLSSAKLLALASEIRAVTRDFHARLIIHSQLDVALAVGADGLHLAASDIPALATVRQWLGDGDSAISLSASCHSADELAQAAHLGADFAMLSPVFHTASHPGAPHLGVDKFHALASEATLPVIALGGIDCNNCSALTGHDMAAISALLAASDPEAAAAAMRTATGG